MRRLGAIIWSLRLWLLIPVVLIALFVARELLTEPRQPLERPANAYPQDVVNAFLRSCTAGGNERSSCVCAIERLRREFTYEEFRSIEDAIAAGGERGERAASAVNSTVAQCATSR